MPGVTGTDTGPPRPLWEGAALVYRPPGFLSLLKTDLASTGERHVHECRRLRLTHWSLYSETARPTQVHAPVVVGGLDQEQSTWCIDDWRSHRRCPAAAVPHVYPETAPLAPTVARVFLLPCRAPCVPSRLPRKKCRPPLPKLPPRTLFEWPNFAQTHQPPLGYYTSDAHYRPVASRVQS